MQDNWLHKIRNHEKLPPAEAWVNIANELDKENKNITEDLAKKILAYEATPPASALNNIFNQLDAAEESGVPVFAEKIKNYTQVPPAVALTNIFNQLDAAEESATPASVEKIKKYTQVPPAAALTNIFNQLDAAEESNTPAFVEKIKKYTQVPPAAAWQNIIGELGKDENVIQLYPKKSNLKPVFLRIAAAAAVIAIVWITVISNSKKITTDSTTAKPKEKQNSLPGIINTPVTPPQKGLQQKNEVAITPANKVVPVKPLQTISTDYIKGNEVNELAQSPGIGKKEKLQNIHGETPMDIALLNTPNTYISVTGADGQSVKVSSKFSNLVGAFSKNSETKEGIDIIIDESAKWRPIIEAWKSKMTNNSIAPSLSNFMDIIALSEILEEKK